MLKIGVLIPCYNVHHSIKKVLTSIPSNILQRIDQIVTVDNNSQDDTLQILESIQNQSGEIGKKLVIIKNFQNYGLGGSQKIAYRYFLDHGFSHFFIVHGDGQGDSHEISKNFFKIFDQKPDIDLIIASRFMKGSHTKAYNPLRVFGNHVFNLITYVCSGHHMSDSGAAIIFIRVEILKHVIFEDLTNSFQFNPELNIFLYNLKNLKIVEIPLSWSDSKDKSNISSLNYCLTLLKILLRYRFNKTFLRRSATKLFHEQSQRITPSYQILTKSL